MRDHRIGRLNGRFVVIWYEDDGQRRRYRLEARTAKEAEREARDVMLRLTAPPSGATVDQIWSAYRADMGDRRQASKLAQVGLNVLPVFGHLSTSQISADDCRSYVAKRRQSGRKDATIRAELGCLRSAMLWEQKNGLIDRAPRIEMPMTPPPRERYLSHGEVDKLYPQPVTRMCAWPCS